jgi:predicted small lipoprotein YifL
MKRLTGIVLIAALLAALAACGGPVESESASSTSQAQRASQAPQAGESAATQSSEPAEPAPEPRLGHPPEDYDFAAIRAAVPYEGLQLPEYVWEQQNSPFIDVDDETARRIVQYVDIIDIGEQEVLSRYDLSAESVTYPAIQSTSIYSPRPDFAVDYYPYLPELEPVWAAKSYMEGYSYSHIFCLKEHVEESIRLLFGEDMVPAQLPRFGSTIVYDETIGIYEFLPRGGGGELHTITLGYEDLSGQYRVKVAYVADNVDTFQKPGTGEEIYPDSIRDEKTFEDAFMAYVQDPANQYELYLEKNGDSLFFDSQIPVCPVP